MPQQGPKKYGPKPADSPSIGFLCPACGAPFAEGDYTMLAVVGPGGDEDARKAAREGRTYQPAVLEIHWACVTGHSGEETQGRLILTPGDA